MPGGKSGLFSGTRGAKGYRPTNADRIRAMSDEELAKWLIRLSEGDKDIKFCVDCPECDADLEQDREIPQERCAECLLSWLRQPHEEAAL